MTKKILVTLTAVMICATAICATKEVAKLNAWVMPNGMDNAPCDGNAGRYTVYMTEFHGSDVMDLRDSVLEYCVDCMGCTRICNMFLYYTHNQQYCTYLLEYEEDADTSTVIDGKYQITNHSVAVIVYDDGENMDVCVIGDIYNTVSVYGCYFVDDKEPSDKFAPWVHQRGTGVEDVMEEKGTEIRKTAVDGRVYVEREGLIYDMNGRIVRK